jgi:hypothetical protein
LAFVCFFYPLHVRSKWVEALIGLDPTSVAGKVGPQQPHFSESSLTLRSICPDPPHSLLTISSRSNFFAYREFSNSTSPRKQADILQPHSSFDMASLSESALKYPPAISSRRRGKLVSPRAPVLVPSLAAFSVVTSSPSTARARCRWELSLP